MIGTFRSVVICTDSFFNHFASTHSHNRFVIKHLSFNLKWFTYSNYGIYHLDVTGFSAWPPAFRQRIFIQVLKTIDIITPILKA